MRFCSARTDVKVAKIRMISDWEDTCTGEGQPEARAVLGADQSTEPLVVMLRTLRPAVTHLTDVQAGSKETAATEEAGTRVAVTPVLVLTARAVDDAVTPDVDGQTVPVPWTLEVGLRTDASAAPFVISVRAVVHKVAPYTSG